LGRQNYRNKTKHTQGTFNNIRSICASRRRGRIKWRILWKTTEDIGLSEQQILHYVDKEHERRKRKY